MECHYCLFSDRWFLVGLAEEGFIDGDVVRECV